MDFGFPIDPMILSVIGALGGVLVLVVLLVAATVYAWRGSRYATRTLREALFAKPILLKIATEFAPDHNTTLKDTTNRLENMAKKSEDMNHIQQESINKILAQLAQQAVINDQVDAILAKLLTQLYAEQARLVTEGDSKAAIVLQTLINDLRKDRDALREQGHIGINVNLAGAGSTVGQGAAGSGMSQAQSGIIETQKELDKIQGENR